MPDSIRTDIMQNMKSVFLAATPTGGTLWKRVTYTSNEGFRKKGQNTLELLEGTEIYVDKIAHNARDRNLDVELSCSAYIPIGTEIRDGAREVLADMEEVIVANETWGGLAMGTFFQSNVIDSEDLTDRTVVVSLFMNVQYRTLRSNPRA